MDSRILILALPSALILAVLVWHSAGALPRRRAVIFWTAVVIYGFLRGFGVRLVTGAIGASFPYEIHQPMLSIGGVSVQEIAGWAIVSYLAWWIGYRFSLRNRRPFLFLQVLWASIFLGAISWAIEAAAIAARWWHWTVPTASRLFLNVPSIGIVDWFFVGLDFVLPLATITAPALANRPFRWLTLLLFPIHFAGHLLIEPVAPWWPTPVLHAIHWALVLMLLWLALRSTIEDRPFAEEPRSRCWVPSAGFGIMAIDVVIVELFVVRRPELLQSLAPAVVIWLLSLRPLVGGIFALGALLLAIKLPSLLVAAGAAIVSTVLIWLRRQRRPAAAVATLAAALAFATAFHHFTAARRNEMTRRLDRAIADRDRGNLQAATAELSAIARDHPTSHVALVLAGEIYYRTDQLDQARAALARAVEIKQDFVRGYRLLAAIDLQRGRRSDAERWASRGLEVAPNDLELRYLRMRAEGTPPETILAQIQAAETAEGMMALAFEVGDLPTASRIGDLALARWPHRRSLYPTRVRLALAGGDRSHAEEILSVWIEQFPSDREAHELKAQLSRKSSQ